LTRQLDEADTDREDVETLATLTSTWQAYADWRDSAILTPVDTGHEDAALAAYRKDSANLSDSLSRALTNYLATKQSVADDLGTASDQQFAQIRLISIILALVAGGLSVAIGLVLSRKLANGVKDVQRVLSCITDNCASWLAAGLEAMSKQDLTYEIHPATQPIARYGSDEIGQTAAVTNTLLERIVTTIEAYTRARAGLAESVTQVQGTANGLADSSTQLGNVASQAEAAVQQVSSAVQNVAAGSTDASRGAQETNAAVEQLGQAIDGIARGAAEQAQQTQAASDSASHMAETVQRVGSQRH
jgi:methyl-accepting chemotaxis protein